MSSFDLLDFNGGKVGRLLVAKYSSFWLNLLAIRTDERHIDGNFPIERILEARLVKERQFVVQEDPGIRILLV